MKIHTWLYSLRASGIRWDEILVDCLGSMSFLPYKVEPDIWTRERNSLYKYTVLCIDNISISPKHIKYIIDTMVHKYKFKIKGTGPIKYHVGYDFFRDEDDTL